GQAPPPLDAVESALEAYAAEVAALRRDGVTRSLTDDAAERFFALGFALEQMHTNFMDLGRCAAEWAEPVKETGRGKDRPA
ncbi:MAG: FUSC family protein, partial [Xanthobacteraceae bacterium]